MDIFTFVKGYNLAFDITSDWFQDLWYPLSKSQPIQLDGLKKVNFQPIIVTTNLEEEVLPVLPDPASRHLVRSIFIFILYISENLIFIFYFLLTKYFLML